MKKFKTLAGLILLACAGNSFAEWQENARIQNIRFYFESDSIAHNDGVVSVTELYDHETPQRLPNWSTFLSQRLEKEYDCETSMHRVNSLTTYDGNMTMGPYRQTREVQPWVPVKPNSYSALMLRALCTQQVIPDA